MGFDPGTSVGAQALIHLPITTTSWAPLGTSAQLQGGGADRTTCRHEFWGGTIIIAGCKGHEDWDKILLGPRSARVELECGDKHFWLIQCHEFIGAICFLIWALFLQLDFRTRYIYVFAKFFCWVNEITYPFESRTWRCSAPRMNFVIKFLCSNLMFMSLHF